MKGKVENPTTVLILGLFTCGIYIIIWFWQRVREMNTYLGREQVNPLFIFPGIFCAPFFWYAIYLFAKGMPDMQRKAGMPVSDDLAANILMLVILAPVGQFLIQKKLNEIWEKR